MGKHRCDASNKFRKNSPKNLNVTQILTVYKQIN